MTFWIIYLLKVILIQGGLYLCYWLFFIKTKRHQFNRLFLLSGLITSFIIPFIELPTQDGLSIMPENELVITWLTEPTFDYEVVLFPIEKTREDISLWIILPLLYILITAIFLARSLRGLISLHQFKRHSEIVKKYWYNLFKTSHSRPFSFFSNVFIPKSLFDSEDFEQVLAHECVHVKQRHSVDRLFLDFFVSLFWFNPFIYLYRNALIEIHEYQADEEVVNRFKDPIHYQEILFSQLQVPQYSGMVSHFNVEIIKKRIVMMNKQNKQSKWIYLLVAPLTLIMIFAFSGKEAMFPIEQIGKDISAQLDPVMSYDFPEIILQNNFDPSILPLKKHENVRMTSGFGMRMHPIYKVEKMHLGMDFSCAIGSEVIAVADGIVEDIKTTFDGYGKRITIKHGEKYKTMYAQLSAFNVKKGDKVTKGQFIGLSGNSGASTAPHLHYEIIDLKKAGRIDPKPFIKNYEFKVSVKSESSSFQEEKYSEKKNKSKFKPSISPVNEADDVEFLADFGKKIHPIYKVEKMHTGIDFKCRPGTSVLATSDGIIAEVETSATGYGKKIIIMHGKEYQTLYAHLSGFNVEKGVVVKKGQVIGFSGNTGSSTSPHLHYEVIDLIAGGKVDPKPFITNYEFKSLKNGISKSSKIETQREEHLQELELGERDQIIALREKNSSLSELEKAYEEEKTSQIEREKAEDARQRAEVARLETESQKAKLESEFNDENVDEFKEERDLRLQHINEFLTKYNDGKYVIEDWNIVFKDDRVVLKRKSSLERITLYEEKYVKP